MELTARLVRMVHECDMVGGWWDRLVVEQGGRIDPILND